MAKARTGPHEPSTVFVAVGHPSIPQGLGEIVNFERIRFLFTPKPRLIWVNPLVAKAKHKQPPNVLCITFKSRVEALRRT